MDAANNLHATILKEVPWYDDLYTIWNGISNFNTKLMNAQPEKVCGADFFQIIAPNKGSIPAAAQLKRLASGRKGGFHKEECHMQETR